MKISDKFAKKLMYLFGSSIKNKHVDAFVRYGSYRKFLNFLKIEYAIRRGLVKDFGYPYMLTIEPTNRCNLRCPLCPTGKGVKGRKLQNLDLDSFKSIINEVSPYVYMINFQNWGEPLLSRKLPEMVSCAHSAGIATTIATNGNYSPKLNSEIVASGLDNIVFAVDGTSQEVYEQYRINGKLDLVVNNIKALIKERKAAGAKRPFVEIQFLVFDHNIHQIKEVRQLADSCGADGLLVRAAVAPGNDKNRKKFYTWNEEKGFCRRFWYTASISADLGMTPCCNFFFKSDDMGSMVGQSFNDVWNGSAYVKNRQAVVTKDYDSLHLNCKQCKKYDGSLGRETYGVSDGSKTEKVWVVKGPVTAANLDNSSSH